MSKKKEELQVILLILEKADFEEQIFLCVYRSPGLPQPLSLESSNHLCSTLSHNYHLLLDFSGH